MSKSGRNMFPTVHLPPAPIAINRLEWHNKLLVENIEEISFMTLDLVMTLGKKMDELKYIKI